MRACSVSETDSHIPLTAGRFCDGCLGNGAGGMSQGLRVLVLAPAAPAPALGAYHRVAFLVATCPTVAPGKQELLIK
jgi:hypothetical protein